MRFRELSSYDRWGVYMDVSAAGALVVTGLAQWQRPWFMVPFLLAAAFWVFLAFAHAKVYRYRAERARQVEIELDLLKALAREAARRGDWS